MCFITKLHLQLKESLELIKNVFLAKTEYVLNLEVKLTMANSIKANSKNHLKFIDRKRSSMQVFSIWNNNENVPESNSRVLSVRLQF